MMLEILPATLSRASIRAGGHEMTIWAVYALAVITVARVLGLSPADWPGTYLIGRLVLLLLP